ncbi:CoA-binding protein [Streptosporangium sp. NPDC051022]|uniref:acetate--CoA ligase family protein n=1 Tax=Streptosporangium sp. NPDC051022 TaxID=3155752 RepID=UPI003437FD02
MPSQPLRPLLAPASVAVVGASLRASRGRDVLQALLAGGYGGRVYPVNPRYEEIDGLTCYPDVASLPEVVDCAVIAVPAEAAVDVVAQCSAHGVGAAVVMASGFGETGAVGADLESRLRAAAGPVALCGPNCLGVLNTAMGLSLGLRSADIVPAGPIGVVMQSGALTSALLDPLARRHVGVSHVVSSGNEAVLDVADYLEALVEDPATRVVAVYVEQIRRPASFVTAARRLRDAGKPVVVLPAGQSRRSATVVAAHTGARPNDRDELDATLGAAGAVRVADVDELVETVLLLAGSPVPPGPRTAFVSYTGGGNAVLGDLGAAQDHPFAELSRETITRLGAILPTFGVAMNPLDITGAAAHDDGILEGCLDILLGAPEVDMVGVSIGPGYASTEIEIRRARTTVEAARRSAKPVFGYWYSAAGFVDPVARIFAEHGVPLLQGAAEVLAATQSLGGLAAAFEGAAPARHEGGRRTLTTGAPAPN